MWELIAGLLLWSMVGGVIPVVNAEAMVVVATLSTSPEIVPIVALVATLGQMIAKLGLFLTARWAPSRLPERARGALERGTTAIERRPTAAGGVIFLSAVVGLPPFYAVSLAAGALQVSWASFLVLGTTGRAVRFGALAWAAAHFGESALSLFG